MTTAIHVKVADEVWIAAALLHRAFPDSLDFSIDEIVARAAEENLNGTLRPGVYVHVVQHCVANRPPNPGRYRMLYETRDGYRRLFRQGDAEHPERSGSKITPSAEEISCAYSDLLGWYRDWCVRMALKTKDADPLLSLVGSGKNIWISESADAYVNRLRLDWK